MRKKFYNLLLFGASTVVLAGCTTLPEFDGGEYGPPVDAIVRHINCELLAAVEEFPVIAIDGKTRSAAGWGAASHLTLTVDEAAGLTPTISSVMPYTNPLSSLTVSTGILLQTTSQRIFDQSLATDVRKLILSTLEGKDDIGRMRNLKTNDPVINSAAQALTAVLIIEKADADVVDTYTKASADYANAKANAEALRNRNEDDSSDLRKKSADLNAAYDKYSDLQKRNKNKKTSEDKAMPSDPNDKKSAKATNFGNSVPNEDKLFKYLAREKRHALCGRAAPRYDLVGDAGVVEVLRLGFRARVADPDSPTELKKSEKVYDGGAFGQSLTFVVNRNVSASGPNWTLTHFKGPVGLFGAARNDTHKLTIAFAPPPAPAPLTVSTAAGGTPVKAGAVPFTALDAAQQHIQFFLNPNGALINR